LQEKDIPHMNKPAVFILTSVLVLGFTSSENTIQSSEDVIFLSGNTLVSLPGNIKPQEVSICINPTDPLNVVAGSNLDYYYYSKDGGSTWTEGRLSSSLGVWGDPSLVFDAEGNLYFGHLSNPIEGDFIDRIVVQKSSDGGETWTDGAGIGLNPPKDQDKEWLAVDMTDSPYRNSIYMAWTEFDRYGSPNPEDRTRILFSYSRDFSEAWSRPVIVSDVTGDCRLWALRERSNYLGRDLWV
jgi:hypothetical protein